MIRPILASPLVALLCACSPYSAAWRTMDAVVQGRDATEVGLAEYGKAELKRCADVEDKAACLAKASEAITHWRNIARPAINSALRLTVAAVEIAERAGNKDLGWLDLLRPAVCALVRVARSWSHYYQAAWDQVAGPLAAVEVLCHD